MIWTSGFFYSVLGVPTNISRYLIKTHYMNLYYYFTDQSFQIFDFYDFGKFWYDSENKVIKQWTWDFTQIENYYIPMIIR